MENLPLNLLLISSIIKILVIVHMLLIGVMGMIWAERRVSAWIQDRYGPNRVGPQGLLQPIADGIKFLLKEDLIPEHVDKIVYIIAPAIILIPALITCAVVPFGNEIPVSWGGQEYKIPLQIADIDIGILYILAITSLGVYGVVLGAWASNNKYSFLGGLRASAQMVSYELSLGLSIVGVLMLSESLRLREIVLAQSGFLHWNFLTHFPAFLVFTISVFAETNRLPFDLAEAEQELVGGYHTEYSSMKFAMYFMAEYMHMIVGSVVVVVLFLGGWYFPGLEKLVDSGTLIGGVLSFIIVFVKTAFFLFFFIWVRWSLPRFRYDQLMNLGWKVLLPIALTSIVVTAVVWLVSESRLWVGILNFISAVVVASVVTTLVSMRKKTKVVIEDDLDILSGESPSFMTR